MKNSSFLIYSIFINLGIVVSESEKIYKKIQELEDKMYKYIETDSKRKSLKKRIDKLKVKYQKSFDVSGVESRIINILSKYIYNKATPYTIKQCKRIYNEIENGYYTHNDLIISYIYQSLYNKKVKMSMFTEKTVINTMKLFTRKQLRIDKKFIIDINKKLKIDNIGEFFRINNKGENIIYNLIMKKYITPIFYLQFRKNLLTLSTENSNLKNNYYLHFERLNNIILKFLN